MDNYLDNPTRGNGDIMIPKKVINPLKSVGYKGGKKYCDLVDTIVDTIVDLIFKKKVT